MSAAPRDADDDPPVRPPYTSSTVEAAGARLVAETGKQYARCWKSGMAWYAACRGAARV